jgi:Glycosyltransferase
MFDFIIIYDRVFNYGGDDITIGGIQTYLVELARLIKENGYTVSIFQRSYKSFENSYRDIPFKGINSTKNKLVSFTRLAFEAKKNLHKNGVVIWGNDQTSVKLKDIKTISIQHGITFDIEGIESKIKRQLIGTPLYSIYRFCQRLNALRKFERADYHVCVDYNFLNWYRTYKRVSYPNNIKVIPNFSDIPLNYLDIEKPKRPSIVFARRFVERRGCLIFCEAIKRLKADGLQFDVFLAGDGPFKNHLINELSHFDGIYFTKFEAENSVIFHQDKTIAVVCSLGSEGTSLSLLEAMAARCAVISTNIGGLTNIVIDGHNGLICDPDVHSLYEALKRLIINKELCNKLSRNGYETINDSFSLIRWRKSWADLLFSVTNDNKS